MLPATRRVEGEGSHRAFDNTSCNASTALPQEFLGSPSELLGILGVVEVLVKVLPRYLGVALRGRIGKALHESAPVGVPLATVISVLYPNPFLIVLLGITATLFASALTFNFSVEFQRRVSSEKRATAISLRNMVLALATSLFYTAYGFATDFLGLSRERFLFALFFLSTGAFFKLLQGKIERLRYG